MNFYVFICDKKQLNLMSCTWPCASFLLSSITYVLMWHFCICIPGKIFVYGSCFKQSNLAPLIPIVLYFQDFPIKSLTSIFTVQKRVIIWSDRTLLVSVIMRIWLQVVFGFSTFDTVQILEHTGLCSLGASNFMLVSPSFLLSFA